MKQRGSFITWLLLLFIIIFLFNIYILIKDSSKIADRINNLELIAKINKENGTTASNKLVTLSDVIEQQNKRLNKKDEEIDKLKKSIAALLANSPKDGVDGKDGKDGTNGANGVPGENGKDGKDGVNGTNGVDGVNGQDAPMYMLRCNVDRNRWEEKYSTDTSWRIMLYNNEPVKCTRKGAL